MNRNAYRRGLQVLAASALTALTCLLFRIWLHPRDPSLWLGAWLTGLCN
jgi:hypothetical protein